ncbi:MAG: hypothetical protein ABI691_24810 [Ginsengibacter sp.]
MMVQWVGVTKPNTVNNNPVIIDYFFPSILEMAGVKQGKIIQKLNAQSFVPYLKNPQLKETNRPLIFHYPTNEQICVRMKM